MLYSGHVTNTIWFDFNPSERHTYRHRFWRGVGGCHTGRPWSCFCGGLRCLARGHSRQWHLRFDTSNPLVASSIPTRCSSRTQDLNWQPSGCWLASLTARLPAARYMKYMWLNVNIYCDWLAYRQFPQWSILVVLHIRHMTWEFTVHGPFLLLYRTTEVLD